MNEASRNWPGPFGGHRVPINLNSIILGFMAIVVFIAGVYVIELFSDEDHLIAKTSYFFLSSMGENGKVAYNAIYSILPGNKTSLDKITNEIPSYATIGIFSLWFLFVWAFFGGAINRIIAYHIAKQETLKITRGLHFAWKHKVSLLLTPIVLALIIAFFCGCNYVAGWLTLKFPIIGPILFVVFFFFVILSSFFILVLGIGLIFGFNLISSSISTEGCEGIEGVITSLQYIFARPWSYIMYHVFVIVSCVFLLWTGGVFVDIAFRTSLVDTGDPIVSYSFDERWQTVTVVTAKKTANGKEDVFNKYYLDVVEYQKIHDSIQQEMDKARTPEEKAEFQQMLNGIVLYQSTMSDIWAYLQGVNTNSYLWEPEINTVKQGNRPMMFQHLWKLDKFWACIGAFLMLFYYGTQYLVYGYLVAYIFSSSTLIYFLMRKEIDTTDFDEIWEEEISDSNEKTDENSAEDEIAEEIDDTDNKDDKSDTEEVSQKHDNKSDTEESQGAVSSSDKNAEDNKSDTEESQEKVKDNNKSGTEEVSQKNDNKSDTEESQEKVKDNNKSGTEEVSQKNDNKSDTEESQGAVSSSDKNAEDNKSGTEESQEKVKDNNDNNKSGTEEVSQKNDNKSDTEESQDSVSSSDKNEEDNKSGTEEYQEKVKDNNDNNKSGTEEVSQKNDNKSDTEESQDSVSSSDKNAEDNRSDTEESQENSDAPDSDDQDEDIASSSKSSDEKSKRKPELNSDTMAIPLIKRKPRKTKEINTDKFMD